MTFLVSHAIQPSQTHPINHHPPGPVNGTRCPVPVPCRAWSLEPKSQRRPEPWRVRSDTNHTGNVQCMLVCSAAAQRRSRRRQGCGVLDSWLAPIRLTSTRAERHPGAGRCDLQLWRHGAQSGWAPAAMAMSQSATEFGCETIESDRRRRRLAGGKEADGINKQRGNWCCRWCRRRSNLTRRSRPSRWGYPNANGR